MLQRMALNTTLKAGAVLVALTALATGSASAAPRLRKVDTSSQKSLDAGAVSVRVIIRTPAGCRSGVRQALQAHGDTVLRENASVGSMTAVVHAQDLVQFETNGCISSVSADGFVSAHAPPGGGGG